MVQGQELGAGSLEALWRLATMLVYYCDSPSEG